MDFLTTIETAKCVVTFTDPDLAMAFIRAARGMIPVETFQALADILVPELVEQIKAVVAKCLGSPA